MSNIPPYLLSQITHQPPPVHAARNGSVRGIWINTADGYSATAINIKKWLPKAAEFICGDRASVVDVQSALENYLPFTEVKITDDFWLYRTDALRGNVVKTGPYADCRDYLLYIAYVVDIELLRKAVVSAAAPGRNIWVIDSSEVGLDVTTDWLKNCTVLRLPHATTFTQMHNAVIKRAANIGVPYLLFMHSDAEVADAAVIPELLASMDHDTAVSWTNYDALACFNMAAICEIGFWDETFPQYASDCDYFYRIKLSRWQIKQTNLTARVAHFTSVVVRSGDPLRLAWNTDWVLAHYAHKWGGSPSHEILKLPYGIGDGLAPR
jgi:hypothetical protein